ncbi:MAG: hypothetical protein ABIR70_22440 [Bryobacteraceae bacterium]
MKHVVALCLFAWTAAAQLRTDVVYTRFDPPLYSLRKPVPIRLEARAAAGIDSMTFCLPCSTGQTPVRLTMNDQGTGGDLVAGDRTFTITIQPADFAPYLQIDPHKIGGLIEAFNGSTRVVSLGATVSVLKEAPAVNVVSVNATTQISRNIVNMRLTNAEFFGDFQSPAFITKRFYTMFPDDFDLINVVYEGSLFQNRYHAGAQNQVRGIGMLVNNSTSSFGSAGKLLGLSRFPIDSLFDVDQGRNGAVGWLHETAHQWLTFLPDPLFAGSRPHWPFSDLAPGIMGFSDPNNGQGLGIPGDLVPEGPDFRIQNRAGIPAQTFKDLELYLMGFVPASQVGPHFVLRDQTQIAKLNTGLLSGPADTVTIQQIVLNNGARVPDSTASQKTFRMATIYLTLDRMASADEMAFYDHATTLMDGLFNQRTLGLGHINPMIRDIANYIAPTKPEIQWVGQASGGFSISRNGWIEIKGVGLAPTSVGSGLVWSNAPEFTQGKMPTALGGVSVKINGKPAYIYFVSPNQVNVLAGLDAATGAVNVEVTNGAVTSDPFSVTKAVSSPSFFYVGTTSYIAALHADYSPLGPAYMSVPGYTFTPARSGETILLYAGGFGTTLGTLTEGSSSQAGTLPALPSVSIGGKAASVTFAGVAGPGLYQLNVVVPALTPGEAAVLVRFGTSLTTGLIPLQ